MYSKNKQNNASNVRITIIIKKRVHATIVPVGKKQVLHILSVCSLSHSACNAHATYCHLSAVWLYHICSQCLINGMIIKRTIGH